MRIDVACAYCFIVSRIQLGEIVLRKRSEELCVFRCDTCGSSSVVELSTKRKSKGAAQKRFEAKREADHAAEVAAARERNAKIGARLFAQPGCTCAQRAKHYGDEGPARGSGHPLSTGFSRSHSGAMVPVVPRHYGGCPVRDTEAEAEVLVGTGAR